MLLRLEVGMLETNCYIYKDDETGEGMLVDPGGDASNILEIISDNNIKIKYIVLTHGHWDHIGAIERIKAHTNAEILIHENDAECLHDSSASLSVMFGINSPNVKPDRFIKQGDELKVGNSSFKVIHTPGHTPGGICLHGENILLSGDTLFQGAIGRTDLPGGDYKTIMESIRSKLMVLDENTAVYPGHGKKTTIGKEKSNF